jgi:glycosyltransferase involved in cell wall biosynthesis
MQTQDDATLHLINPLRNPYGGSEQRTLETARLLRRSGPLQVWCAPNAAQELIDKADARALNPLMFAFPRRGTIVFVGTYFSVGRWIGLATPTRVVVIFNTDQPRWLRDNLARITSCGRSAEVIYTSVGLRARHHGAGPVMESPIDLDRFAFRAPLPATLRPFTVGRYSRDDPSKHHADDPALYRRLVAMGIRVRLMGATCLAPQLRGVEGIELLPEGTQTPQAFLASLDAFVYRTADTWYEAFGRVIFEAMAAGVPIVCARRGGYTSYTTHGHSALVTDTTDEIVAALQSLRDDPVQAAAMARIARGVVENVQRNARRQLIALLRGAPSEHSRDVHDVFAATGPSPRGD